MIVTLNGLVVDDDDKWLYDWFEINAFCPSMVRQAIEDNPEGEDLILEINSPGGGVLAGYEMYSVLRAAKCRSVAHIQSLAGSAASTLSCGCSTVMLSPVAQMMIHMPSVGTCGNQKAHRASIQALDSITQGILNGYELRCKGKTSRERLTQLMDEETWIYAQEAVEMGLADGILYQDGEEPLVLPKNIVNAVGGGIRSLAQSTVLPVTSDALLARYQQLVRDGAAPAEGHPVDGASNHSNDDWRLQGRLAIENNRFF